MPTANSRRLVSRRIEEVDTMKTTTKSTKTQDQSPLKQVRCEGCGSTWWVGREKDQRMHTCAHCRTKKAKR